MSLGVMKKGVCLIRNPVIARVFRELGYIEQWGSGVPHIFKEAGILGLPPIEIVEIGMRLRFVIPFQEKFGPHKAKTNSRLRDGRSKKDPKVAQSVAQSEDRLGNLVAILNEKPLSAGELSSRLNLGSKTGTLKRDIKELIKKNLIEYTLPEKPTSRPQKYRVTGKGKKYLAKLKPKPEDQPL